jgi:hypothetical protein
MSDGASSDDNCPVDNETTEIRHPIKIQTPPQAPQSKASPFPDDDNFIIIVRSLLRAIWDYDLYIARPPKEQKLVPVSEEARALLRYNLLKWWASLRSCPEWLVDRIYYPKDDRLKRVVKFLDLYCRRVPADPEDKRTFERFGWEPILQWGAAAPTPPPPTCEISVLDGRVVRHFKTTATCGEPLPLGCEEGELPPWENDAWEVIPVGNLQLPPPNKLAAVPTPTPDTATAPSITDPLKSLSADLEAVLGRERTLDRLEHQANELALRSFANVLLPRKWNQKREEQTISSAGTQKAVGETPATPASKAEKREGETPLESTRSVTKGPKWEPCRNPAQRLIVFLDAMAIALNRFHTLSLGLPQEEQGKPFDTVGYHQGRKRLLEQFDTVRKTILPWDKFGPRASADRLKREVITHFARPTSPTDERIAESVERATTWLDAVADWSVGTARPWNYFSPNAGDPHDSAFDRERLLLSHYRPAREKVLEILARFGQQVPQEIEDSYNLAFHVWTEPDSPLSQDDLLDMVRDALPRGDGAADVKPPAATEGSEGTPPGPLSAVSGCGVRGKTGGPESTRRKKVTRAEAEIRVSEWLKEHAKGNPVSITRDAVAEGTGVSTGMVSNTDAWKMFDAERKRRAKTGPREVPLSDKMQAMIPADCPDPAELAALIEGQEKERQQDEKPRRHRLRHDGD